MEGKKYPDTFAELERMFASESDCYAYLRRIRWPDGFVCPRCGAKAAWETGRGLLVCSGCRSQRSVVSGTLFHRSHLPMKTWFRAMWCVCSGKSGVSALGLERSLGIGSYNTAWLCLHRLRRAMVRPGRERLSGVVEADEAYLGAPQEGRTGRGAYGKRLVFVAVERKGSKIGRIRMACIPDATKESLRAAVGDNVEPGSEVRTDGWFGYKWMERASSPYRRVKANGDEREVSECLLPKCHLVISLFRRWLDGTLQGSVGADHLQDYLNEFVFRFNRRSSRSRGLLFRRLAEMAVASKPNPRMSIVGGGRQDVVSG